MISDILYEASEDIRSYLDHPATRDCYQGKLREEIEALFIMLKELQYRLDAPPTIQTTGE